MNHLLRPVYSPALRMKKGELEGVRQLAEAVADCILPRFIVPPQIERDKTGPLLIEAEAEPDISVALGDHWRQRPVLVDTTYIIDEYGRDRLAIWLSAMFERARDRSVKAIPMALLRDLTGVEVDAFRAVIAADERTKFAICVSSEEMVGPEFGRCLGKVLDGLRLSPEDCAVLVDFSGSEFSNPEIVAPIISGALENVQDFGRWQQIIFQGTHYPETNPAQDGSVNVWPRNEWLAWQKAVKFDPTTEEYMIFGDYAADCAKMKFGKSGAPAIRHIRYATSNSWRIQRAVKSGTDAHRMRGVYKAILNCDDFAGESFSQADAYIAHAASDFITNPGSAATWRQINTTHHITRVVTDIADVRGITLKKASANKLSVQLPLPV